MVKKKSFKKLMKFSDPKSFAELIQQPTSVIAEALTGLLASEKREQKLIAGRLIQGALKFKLLTQFGRELRDLREKGKIKEDYFATNKQQATLLELLKFIDGECPDEELFKALKSIFFASISKNVSEQDELSAYGLLKVCKKLSGEDILILKACFDIAKLPAEKQPDLRGEDVYIWFKEISQKIGHKIPDLVKRREKNLMSQQLITDRVQPHNFNIPDHHFKVSKYFRLTPLGYKLCEFITQYSEE